MPIYDFKCSNCGVYELRASYETDIIPCNCGRTATRLSIYSVNHKIEGQSMPRPDDHAGTQEEMGKVLKKKGWGMDRSLEEMRKHRTYDQEGRMFIDTPNLPKEA